MQNKQRTSAFLAICLAISFALPGICGSPFTLPPTFQNQVDGTVIFAATWNSVIGGLYTYFTSTLLPQLNVLQNKGDTYGYTGSTLVPLSVGSNGQVLTANSAAASGISWASAGGLPITTKGDTVIGNASGVAVRLPVGTNGTVLTADSTQTNGAAWEAVSTLNAPSGSIIMFNYAYVGAIPTGWVICDGTNGTPNMIGMIPIGAQPSSGASSPNSNGYGNVTYGAVGGATTVSPAFSASGNVGNDVQFLSVSGAPANTLVASYGHTHSYSISGTCTPVSTQPATYGLIFIMKT